MSNPKVITYIICQDKIEQKTNRTSELKNLFSNPVNVVTIDVPDIPFPKTLTKEQMVEISRLIYCLTDARKLYPDHHIMILRNDSVSNVSSSELNEMLNEITNLDYDIAYLCKWNDACHKYNFEKASNVGKSVLLGSSSPHGTQAFVLSPTCRDKLLGLVSLKDTQKIQDYTVGLSDMLNQHISSGNLEALTVVPNAFDIDLGSSKNPSMNLNKLNECSSKSSNNAVYIIIGAMLALIITIVIILLMKKRN